MNETDRWHGSTDCPECGVPRMVEGEPRCRPCALDARDRFFARVRADDEEEDNRRGGDLVTQMLILYKGKRRCKPNGRPEKYMPDSIVHAAFPHQVEPTVAQIAEKMSETYLPSCEPSIRRLVRVGGW